MNFTTGQRVTGHISNPVASRVEFTGTVSAAYRTGGKDIVNVTCDDGQERSALAENLAPVAASAENLRTHTGVVHAPGRPFKQLRGGLAPKCCASASAVSRYHYLIPTSEPVTCRRCLAARTKEATHAA